MNIFFIHICLHGVRCCLIGYLLLWFNLRTISVLGHRSLEFTIGVSDLCTVNKRKTPKIRRVCNLLRDWCPKFATGLNIKNVIVQKVYEWSGWYFTKMMPPRGYHYDKRTTLSMLYFLNYAYFYIWSSRKFCLSVSISWKLSYQG